MGSAHFGMPLADPVEGARDAPSDQISLIFMEFLTKSFPNKRLAHPPLGLTHPLLEILDAPLHAQGLKALQNLIDWMGKTEAKTLQKMNWPKLPVTWPVDFGEVFDGTHFKLKRNKNAFQ